MAAQQGQPETLVDGLVFPEGPRWRGDTLWFSDIVGRRVHRVGPGGQVETVVELPENPSGLGWQPDGDLLVVSMKDRRLLRVTIPPAGHPGAPEVSEVADLSGLAPHDCNDMVVDRAGRAYVGSMGNPIGGAARGPTGAIILVVPGEAPRVVADQLVFPNGCAVTPDGHTFVLAESGGRRLLAYDISGDGSLSGRRVFADLGTELGPDGICLDAEGAVWVASPRGGEAVRVLDGGTVTHRVDAGRPVLAVALGGGDGRTLYLCTTPSFHFTEAAAAPGGRIDVVRVDVPGVECP